jgi:hypothetical protein
MTSNGKLSGNSSIAQLNEFCSPKNTGGLCGLSLENKLATKICGNEDLTSYFNFDSTWSVDYSLILFVIQTVLVVFEMTIAVYIVQFVMYLQVDFIRNINFAANPNF